MMHRTLRSLTVFAIILMELCSSSSTIYHPHTFAPKDNQQKYLKILQEKYHGSWHCMSVIRKQSPRYEAVTPIINIYIGVGVNIVGSTH